MPDSQRECAGCAELTRRIERLERELDRLQGRAQRVQELEAENRDLRARINLTSRNSSKPPSSDAPSAPPRPPAKPSGRKQGAQPGHEGSTRQPFAATQVDEQVVVRPARCGACRRPLPASAPTAGEPEVVQVVDIPPSIARVTEYVVEAVCCASCQAVTAGEVPAEAAGVIGPRLQAVLTVLTGKFRMSRREAVEAVEALFGPTARISAGWVSELEQRTSQALAPAHVEAQMAVERAPVLHADETSFPEKNKKGWLWTASTALVAFFRHDPCRSREAAERLLGGFSGVLVVDRWVSYRHHAKRLRQICFAHLKRNFQELVDRGKPAEALGRAGLKAIADVYALWKEHEEGRVSFESLRRRVSPIRLALFRALTRGKSCPDVKAAAMAKDLITLFPCLWTFTRQRGVPLTNNLAERRIRPAVLWRKGCFGTQSPRGSRFVERILTVVQTLKLQGRCALEFIEQAIRAARRRRQPPRLLPS